MDAKTTETVNLRFDISKEFVGYAIEFVIFDDKLTETPGSTVVIGDT